MCPPTRAIISTTFAHPFFFSNQRNAFLLVVSSDCNWNNFIPKDNIKRKIVTNRGDTHIADAVLVICVSPLNAGDGVYNI